MIALFFFVLYCYFCEIKEDVSSSICKYVFVCLFVSYGFLIRCLLKDRECHMVTRLQSWPMIFCFNDFDLGCALLFFSTVYV